MTHPTSPADLRTCSVCDGSGLVSAADPYKPHRPRAVTPCPLCGGTGHHLVIKETP